MVRPFLSLVLLAAGCLAAMAADPPQAGDDESAIRQMDDAYVAAFNRGDAAALAACWCEDGAYISPAGETWQGRAKIQEAFVSFFAENQGAKLEVEVASIRVEAPDAAVEEGTARVTAADQPVAETTYVARYLKQDGAWKLKSLQDADPAPSHYEQLQELEWMIGTWGDADENATVQTTCRWTKNKNFISRSFAVAIGDHVDLEGTQVIGWDPDKQVIRSWLFDSDGGFGVGLWSRDENRWTIRALQVLPDGRKGTAVNILTQVDEDKFTWESTGREIDGEILPNVGPVTVVRQTTDQ